MLTKLIGCSKNSRVCCKRRFRRVMAQCAIIESRKPWAEQFDQTALKRHIRNYKR